MADEQTAQELIAEAGKDPTLDELYRRDPATLSDDEFESMIAMLRENRAAFIEKEMSKGDKE